MSELIVFCLLSVVAPIFVMVSMVSIGGALFLTGQLYYYAKEKFREHRASRR